MATQLTLWNTTPEKRGWNDVRIPDAYYAHYKAYNNCPNCRQPLRHPLHALNHYKKFHMHARFRFFVWRFDMWNEVPQTTYLKARAKKMATAKTK